MLQESNSIDKARDIKAIWQVASRADDGLHLIFRHMHGSHVDELQEGTLDVVGLIQPLQGF